MIPKKASRRWMPGQVMWVSMGVAALIWVIDAVVFDVLILRDGTYLQQLFSPEPVNLWMRSLVMSLVLAFGVFGQREVNTHRRQRERYQALLHLGGSVGEAIIVLQDNERGEAIQVFVSDEWPRMTGYPENELRGMSFFDLVRLEDRDGAGQRHRRKMSGEAMPGLFEMTVIRKDGSEFPIELTSARSDFGGERANVAFIRDISERREKEQALAASEERYRAVVDNASEGITVSQDGLMVFVNQRAAELSGSTVQELTGKLVTQVIHPDDREAVAERHRRRTEGDHVPQVYPVRIVDKEGGVKWVELSSVVIAWDGRPAALTFLSDITERKQAEERLGQIAAEWRRTFDSIASPISIHDTDFRLVRVNKAFAETFGGKPEELVGKHCYEVVHGAEAPVPDCPYARMLATGDVVSEESFEPHLGIHVQVSSSPIFSEGGEVSGCVHVIDDITERKQAEERLDQYRLHLERLVEERTDALELAEQRATTDGLTGLFNHRYFHERFDEEIARCSRFGDVCSLIVLDVDHFKSYNDAYGHPAGDEVLRQLGRIIDQCTRDVDLGFRYGGDEFAILLTGTGLEGASRLAERIREAVEAQTGLLGTPQSCSVGVASWPTDGVLREDVIQSADAALYHAKQTGKNRVCLASETVLADVLRTGVSGDGQSGNSVLSIIYALAATVDAKDPLTHGHCRKVSKWATDVSEALGHSTEEVDRIRAAALLHDIGKISMSDRLLTTREPLVDGDWKQIHAHPDIGVAILKHVDSLRGCLAGIRHHHERYDGTGYPAGLQGANIPLDARILAVADSYDAMTSKRPYRRRKATKKQALAELKRGAGTQFDPMVVEVFTRLITGCSTATRESEAAPVATLTTG